MEDDAAKQRPLFPAESLPSLICEFFGTFIFQFMAGCVVLGASSLTTAALGIGFTLMVLTFLFLKRSGAHFNPSVTAAVMVSGQRPHEHFTLAIGFMYILVQFLGAVLGALVASYCVAAPLDVLAATGEACAGSEDDCAHDVGAMHFLTVGILSARNGISVFTMEFTCTFALVWVYFASVVDPTSRAGGLAPISLGFAMIVGVIASGPGTGSSMSPARTLGPAIVLGHYAHCVAPVFGTLLGGIVAGMAYNYLFLFADDEPVPDLYRLTAEPGHHEAESFMRKRHAERALVEHGVGGYTPRNYTPLTETPPRAALPPGSKQTYV